MIATAETRQSETDSEPDTLGERLLSFLFEPAVVAAVRSLNAIEADIEDAALMQYYVDHPETDRNDLTLEGELLPS